MQIYGKYKRAFSKDPKYA